MPSEDPSPPPMRSRSGMLPPDGAHWPPLPAAPADPAPVEARPLPEVVRRPDGAEAPDWRDMALAAPDGYAGSATAPRPVPVWDAWCIAAVVLAAAGLVVGFVRLALVNDVTGQVLGMAPSALGVAFGVIGRRRTMLDPSRRGRWLATGAVVVGVAGLAAAALWSG